MRQRPDGREDRGDELRTVSPTSSNGCRTARQGQRPDGQAYGDSICLSIVRHDDLPIGR